MHRPLFVLAAGSVAAVGALVVASAMPAGAATSVRAETMARTCTVDTVGGFCTTVTPLTFTVTTTGVLAMTAPGTTALPDVAVGATIPATDLGPVTVTDSRDIDPADWTVTVYSSGFTTGSGLTLHTILASAATYDTNGVLPTTNITDNGTFGLLTTPQPAVSEAGDVGNNTATWDPSISIVIPGGAIAGDYTGTLTHSVT